MIREAEAAKYKKAWGLEAYHQHSPGAHFTDLFYSIAKPVSGQSVIDIGAGDGQGSRILKDRGLIVTAFDLADMGWEHTDIPLRQGCLWRGLGGSLFDYGYCCDVIEHIPTQFVGLAISNILAVCGQAFFSVCFRDDVMGSAIGEPLHLTVKPFAWWRDTFREIGTVMDARDLIGDGIFYVRA